MRARIFLQASMMTVLLPLSAMAQDAATWQQQGLFWTFSSPETVQPVVDEERVKEQMEQGCSGSILRFGDTAPMRGLVLDGDWPRAVRDMVATSALTDNPNEAYALLRDAIAQDDLGPAQIWTLQNRLVLTALQFDDPAQATMLLSEFGSPEGLSAALLSDRLLWTVVAQFPGISDAEWDITYLPMLDRAVSLDQSSFQARFWRVVGWLDSEAWMDLSCRDAASAYSDMILDMSDAGACSLMIGHFSHALDIELGASNAGQTNTQQSLWSDFTKALLARVSRNPEVATALIANMRLNAIPCSDMLATEIDALGAL